MQKTARALLAEGCGLVNFGEDLGIASLRISKMRYRPLRYKKKFTVKAFNQRANSASRFGRAVQDLASRGRIPAFFVLSLYGDPFLVTIYLRDGAGRYAGLSHRDWMIIWTSVIVSNAYWTVRWAAIVEVVRVAYRLLQP